MPVSPTAALLLAQAQSYTRFGNGAKKSFANEVTNPGTWRQKIPRKTPRQDEDAELTESCEPHSTGLRRPPRFQTRVFLSDEHPTLQWLE